MINSNRPDLQVADSFGESNVPKALSKKENEGYLRFCKRHGLRVGWQQNRGGFSYKNREKES
jgi:hypothetical protein